MEFKSNYVSNYDFVPYHQPEFYISTYNSKAPLQQLNGYINVKIECVDNVYIGSGFSKSENRDFVMETIKYDNKPIIPASTLKGVIRDIASAVSSSCLPKPIEDKKSFYIEKQNMRFMRCEAKYDNKTGQINKSLCLVCDMFGTMSYGSKVDFSDMTSNNAKLVVTMQKQQYTPDCKTKAYNESDGSSKGYKFYKTHCTTNPLDLVLKVEAIEKNSIFTGKVFFKKLSEQQLSLLLFSMGMDGSFNPKIGGWKNDGLGTIKITALDFVVDGKDDDVVKYAGEYSEKYGENLKAQITKLREILKP